MVIANLDALKSNPGRTLLQTSSLKLFFNPFCKHRQVAGTTPASPAEHKPFVAHETVGFTHFFWPFEDPLHKEENPCAALGQTQPPGLELHVGRTTRVFGKQVNKASLTHFSQVIPKLLHIRAKIILYIWILLCCSFTAEAHASMSHVDTKKLAVLSK